MTPRPAALLALALLVSGCTGLSEPNVDIEAERAEGAVNPLDQDSLNDLMLTVAGADEAVSYFRQALAQNPEDAELRRGYARALDRNGQYGESRLVWRRLIDSGEATRRDRVDYAFVLARLDLWDEVEEQLSLLPPGQETSRQLLVRAFLADQRGDWDAADAAYARAREISPEPASVVNNWGVSEMARGDMAAAEARFEEAVALDPRLFGAKNNLAIAYGLQRKYRVPLVTLAEVERAIVLHNLGVVALRQGDREIGRDLLEQSLAAHPRHYAPAADKLAALGAIQ
ncbi:MAG: tetratricopeptide repeat protein [Paracoccaceae bacterium]